MEENKRYVRLGLFVFLTVLILAAVLFILGGRSLFEPTFTFETYFNESVAGLEIGAPVRYRGVPLGQVTEIVTAAAAYQPDVPLEQRNYPYIVVRAKLSGSRPQVEQWQREVEKLVARGLRAQTQLAGITGQQYLALDLLDPKKYPPLPVGWTPKYSYVPSAPSLTGEIVANAQEFLASLNKAEIQELGQNLNKLIVTLEKKAEDLPVADLSGKAEKALDNANATIEQINRILAEAPIRKTLDSIASASARLDDLLAAPGLKQTVDNAAAFSGRLRKLADEGELDRLVKHFSDTAERLDAMIGDNQYDVRVIVQDLRTTADNLRVLSEHLKRYPAGALIGGPPEKMQVPGKSP
jgi:phospholipid/cholesterol/gamma-HCH transport system substrate-binding protein/paraquat-inducible protein B